jgi:hypothetical protein
MTVASTGMPAHSTNPTGVSPIAAILPKTRVLSISGEFILSCVFNE